MPNRVIKESAFTSERIAKLSDFEFRVWVGLITQADDAGRGDARPAIIKGRIFALRDRIGTKEIENALSTLAAYKCIDLYTVGGKSFYEFPNWAAHQRVRDVNPKYPGKDEADDILPQSAAICGELRQSAANCGLNPIQSNPIQSESESERESNARTCARETEPKKSKKDKDFDIFWDAYPKKVAKLAARKAFDRVKVPVESLLSAIEQQKCGKQWTDEGGKYIPNPATWLNQGRWEDDTANALVQSKFTKAVYTASEANIENWWNVWELATLSGMTDEEAANKLPAKAREVVLALIKRGEPWGYHEFVRGCSGG